MILKDDESEIRSGFVLMGWSSHDAMGRSMNPVRDRNKLSGNE